jgi:hypothetical protein
MQSGKLIGPCALVFAMLAIAAGAQAQPSSALWASVDQALGRTGTTQPDGVRRYSLPRSDLQVQLDGVTIKPALALGSWLAFQPMGANSVVMGDLVLTPGEVNPVMSELLRGGIHVTAVHNHLLRSSPQTIYMHVRGQGDPARLAATLHAALALSQTPQQPPAAAPQVALDFDTAALDRIIGRGGKASGGVYQFTARRTDRRRRYARTGLDGDRDSYQLPADRGRTSRRDWRLRLARERGRPCYAGDALRRD